MKINMKELYCQEVKPMLCETKSQHWGYVREKSSWERGEDHRERGCKCCHSARYAHKKIARGTHYFVHLISQIKYIKITCLVILEASCDFGSIIFLNVSFLRPLFNSSCGRECQGTGYRCILGRFSNCRGDMYDGWKGCVDYMESLFRNSLLKR